MANLNEIVAWLDKELKISEIQDYPGSMNGLQMENDGAVNRIVSAVDASLAVIEEAAKNGGLLLVHHGMFWQGSQPLIGPFFQKIRLAIQGNLAIYSSHLPLDMHQTMGNNVLLAVAVGITDLEPILVKNGWPMGVAGKWKGSREELVCAVENAVGRIPHLCSGGNGDIERVAVITGGAGSEVGKIAALGIGAFITGEGPHWSFIEAEERGIDLIYAGHYATETFGVKYLGQQIAGKFGLHHKFISRNGGL